MRTTKEAGKDMMAESELRLAVIMLCISALVGGVDIEYLVWAGLMWLLITH